MTNSLNELHSLIIYIFFGYLLLLPMVLAGLKVLDIQNPLLRLRLYLLSFLTPPAAFVIYHTLLVKRCESGLAPNWAAEAFHLLCIISEGMLTIFTPLFFILLTMALFKVCIALLMVKRLEKSAVKIDSQVEMMIKDLLVELSEIIPVKAPRIIFSSREGFAAFTTGFIKPVLVVNHRIINLLNRQEIEAMISHELVHIKQRDTFKSWLLHMVRDITMLNPLSSLLLKGYLIEKEVLVDKKAVELSRQSPKDYAAALLKVWRLILDKRSFNPAAISSFTASSMERRVKALLAADQGKDSNAKLHALIFGLVLFAVTLAFLGLVC